MSQFEFDFDEVDVRAESDPDSWHPAWYKSVQDALIADGYVELVWDDGSDDEIDCPF
jgi:hypothetical protein